MSFPHLQKIDYMQPSLLQGSIIVDASTSSNPTGKFVNILYDDSINHPMRKLHMFYSLLKFFRYNMACKCSIQILSLVFRVSTSETFRTLEVFELQGPNFLKHGCNQKIFQGRGTPCVDIIYWVKSNKYKGKLRVQGGGHPLPLL